MQKLAIEPVECAVRMLKNTSLVKDCSPRGRLAMLQFLQLLVNKFGALSGTMQHSDQTLLGILTECVDLAQKSHNHDFASTVYQALAYITDAALAAYDKSTATLVGFMVEGPLKRGHSFRQEGGTELSDSYSRITHFRQGQPLQSTTHSESIPVLAYRHGSDAKVERRASRDEGGLHPGSKRDPG